MQKVVIALLLGCPIVLGHPINKEIVDAIKASGKWTAYEHHENPLREETEENLKGRCGTIIAPAVAGVPEPPVLNLDLPDSFDARDKFGSCVHPIRNQKQCGSCWAFGASEALSDRFCIASSSAEDVVLSAQDLVSCDNTDMGCNGGWLNDAWQYLTTYGDVPDSCMPYTSGSGSVASCNRGTCTGSGSWTNYKCKSGSVVQATSINGIKEEIFTNGPMETAFTVYQDFYNYKSGVYEHVTGGVVGGHAIKVLGWGNEDGKDYWLCANSWGTSWAGLNGFFKIKMNDCGINDAVYACTPDTSSATQQ